MDININILETCIDRLRMDFKIVETSGNHNTLVLEIRKKEVENVLLIDEEIMMI